jgi:NADH-quinone oxidoreductase subunit J
MSGLVLLVAMIGAITLTLRQRDGVKKQSIPQQIERSRDEAVALRKVESGKGIG